MSSSPTNSIVVESIEDEIDLASLFSVLLRFKWLIILVSLTVTGLTAWLTTKLPPVYKATATMLLEVNEVKAVSIEEVYGLDSSRQEYFQTQYEILKSRRLAEKVVQHLRLNRHPDFIPGRNLSLIARALNKAKRIVGAPIEVVPYEPDSEAARLSTLSQFTSRLSITPVSKTQLVKISYESKDPQLAARVVNALGEIYISSHLEEKMSVTLEASDWIRVRLDELKVNLQESELKLQSFREKHALVDATGVVSLISQELNELTSQLSSARQKRTQALAALSFLKDQDSKDVEQLAVIPLFAEHKSVQEIKKDQLKAENDIAALSKRYGPKHNRMIAAQARLEEIQGTLVKRIERLAEGVEQQYQAALENEKELNAELTAVKERYQEVSKLETQYRVLSREVVTNRQLYDTFLTRMKETGAASDFQPAHARFTDKAEPPAAAAKPKKSLIVALAFIASLMLSMMAVLIYEFLNGTIKTAADVEQYLGLRVLGVTPRFKRKRSEKTLPLDCFYTQKAELFNEVWRTLRTGYLLTHHGLSSKVVAVTSTIPGEGKSTTSVNLSYSLSQVEKVLLIEADLRRPTLAQRFHMLPNQPGFFNVLAGTHTINDCIHSEPRSGMDVMVAGTLVDSPLELLSSASLARLLAVLRNRYDRIVIDTPPVSVVSDAMVVAKVSDSFLFVVRSDQVHQKQAKDALEKLRRIHAKVDGVVLNDVPKKGASAYYNYKYQSYYRTPEPPRQKVEQLPTVAELLPLPLVEQDGSDLLESMAELKEIKTDVAFTFRDAASASTRHQRTIIEHQPTPATDEEKFQHYLEKAKRAMAARDYAKARKHLTHIYKLNVKLPLSFYYRMAYTMYMSGEKEQAQKTATYYMKKAGKSGKYYSAARKLVG